MTTLQDGQGWIYIEITKGMYGLKQAGIIANLELQKHMAKYGYRPVKHTPGLWTHDIRPTTFTLVVDDFLVDYQSQDDAKHLIKALEDKYTISKDWISAKYIGINLKWDYKKRTAKLSMPNYINEVRAKAHHANPKKPQHAPAKYNQPTYGATIQHMDPPDNSPRVSEKEIKAIQVIVGSLLYYAIAIDNTILPVLGDIASEQIKATTKTQEKVNHLLDYMATNPNATIEYKASDMILHVHSDASYLSLSKACSRAAGIHFLSTKPPIPHQNMLTYNPPSMDAYTSCAKS